MRILIPLILLLLVLTNVSPAPLLPPVKVADTDSHLDKAVKAVHEHQPFNYHRALDVFFNADSSPLDKIEGLSKLESNNFEKIWEEKDVRRKIGIRWLSDLGTTLHTEHGWGTVLMTKSNRKFLTQLNRKLAKYRPITLDLPQYKDWFRYSFVKTLETDPAINSRDLKSKIYQAIKHNYPLRGHFDPWAASFYEDRRASAMDRAMRILENYHEFGDMPKDGLLKKLYNRMASLSKSRKTSSDDILGLTRAK